MSSTNIKAILFDVDDTLFDRKTAQEKVLARIVQLLPQSFGRFEMSSLMEAWQESDRFASADFEASLPSRMLRDTRSRKFLELLGLGDDLIEDVTQAYLTEYPRVPAPVAGAVTLVRKLSLQFPVGVVSNSLPDVQYRKLETLDLRKYFSCIVLSEEFGIRKPDPRIFQHAATLLNLPPASCLYIGDSFNADVVGSKQAGMLACWFKQGQTPPADQTVKADFTVDNLAEIEEFL